MAFCSKCGATLAEGTAFCGSCGTPAGATGGGATPAAAGSAIASNVAGLLTYVVGLITGIIFLVLEPYNKDKFVRFHAFQSIFFNVATIGLSIVLSILSGVISTVTGGWGAFILLPLDGLVWLAIIALWVFLMYKAYNNERYMLPIIGPMAAKQAG